MDYLIRNLKLRINKIFEIIFRMVVHKNQKPIAIKIPRTLDITLNIFKTIYSMNKQHFLFLRVVFELPITTIALFLHS